MTTRSTERTTRQLAEFAEEVAQEFRATVGVASEEPLDPWELAGILEYNVVTSEDLSTTEATKPDWEMMDARTWSGISGTTPDGDFLILLNADQTPERAAVTLMEEIAHRHFCHTTERLPLLNSEGYKRQYSEDDESEAYWTAAATLLPAVAVARRVWRRTPAEAIASEYGVSKELVEFRIKILNLWPLYKKYGLQAA